MLLTWKISVLETLCFAANNILHVLYFHLFSFDDCQDLLNQMSRMLGENLESVQEWLESLSGDNTHELLTRLMENPGLMNGLLDQNPGSLNATLRYFHIWTSGEVENLWRILLAKLSSLKIPFPEDLTSHGERCSRSKDIFLSFWDTGLCLHINCWSSDFLINMYWNVKAVCK